MSGPYAPKVFWHPPPIGSVIAAALDPIRAWSPSNRRWRRAWPSRKDVSFGVVRQPRLAADGGLLTRTIRSGAT